MVILLDNCGSGYVSASLLATGFSVVSLKLSTSKFGYLAFPIARPYQGILHNFAFNFAFNFEGNYEGQQPIK